MATERARKDTRDGGDKLSLFDASAMAVGGMVGGGIFAVLGTAAGLAGNAAFLAFGLAGLLALVTGLSYARLTVDFDEPGGSFSYVEHIVGPRTAGTVSWFLLLGYLFTISLYAFTFGVYAARLVGVGEAAGPILGAGIIVLLAGLNVAGVRESGLAEDILVVGKMVVLVVVACVGFLAVEPGEALPVVESGLGSAVVAAALVFVAYEGFQLLTYDYDDIEDHRRNLPRAVWISIPLVIVTYVIVAFVTTGALSDEVIARNGETVLAAVARPVLGRAGLVAVLVAAVFSTASAINATLFASARLGHRVTEDGQLPDLLVRWSRGGIPITFIVLMAAGSIAVEATGTLERITTFSSLVFLSVFAVVNWAALAHRSWTGWQKALPVAGLLGCLAAAATLVLHLWRTDQPSLRIVGGISAGLLILRGLYVLLHPGFRERVEAARDRKR
jgi:amino acid transporter